MNESLTKENRELLKLAREEVKKLKNKYNGYTVNGKVRAKVMFKKSFRLYRFELCLTDPCLRKYITFRYTYLYFIRYFNLYLMETLNYILVNYLMETCT